MQIKYSYIYDTQQTIKLTTYKTKNKATTFYKNKNHNKINAVNYSTVQGHPHTDEMAYPDSQLQRMVMNSTIVLL